MFCEGVMKEIYRAMENSFTRKWYVYAAISEKIVEGGLTKGQAEAKVEKLNTQVFS